uniref:Uncharacterized protein n=1 Tax=Peronospora matthiolae TaxID=2874970 RepID=A0AAV1VBU1_9STRA
MGDVLRELRAVANTVDKDSHTRGKLAMLASSSLSDKLMII